MRLTLGYLVNDPALLTTQLVTGAGAPFTARVLLATDVWPGVLGPESWRWARRVFFSPWLLACVALFAGSVAVARSSELSVCMTCGGRTFFNSCSQCAVSSSMALSALGDLLSRSFGWMVFVTIEHQSSGREALGR